MENYNIFIYLACIVFLFIFGKLFVLPVKSIIKLILNSIMGGAIIFLINLIGSAFNFSIGLNIFTAIFVGFLGIPGSILLIILKIFLF